VRQPGAIIELHKEIAYTMPDGRKVTTLFTPQNNKTNVQLTFNLIFAFISHAAVDQNIGIC